MISVMMPVYNAESFLEKSIKSILCQTEAEFELVVINDGSTDASEEIILNFNDPRIVYYKQANKGEASARNKALELVRGDYVVFQDADDISLPTRLQTLKNCFNAPNIAFAHSDMIFIDDFDNITGYFQGRHTTKENTLRQYLKLGNPFHNGSMMIRRSILCSYRYENIKIGTDTVMGLNVARNRDSIHIAQPLLLYRIHEKSSMQKPMDYKTQFEAAHLLLKSNSIEDLVPEIYWEKGNYEDNAAIAKAIISIILHRRDMIEDSWTWITDAQQGAGNAKSQQIISAFKEMFAGNYEFALSTLESIEEKDHIVFNYLGEVNLLLGKKDVSTAYFMKALTIKPDYDAAIENLKGLAGSIAFNFMDEPYYKEFIQHIKKNLITLGLPRKFAND